MLKEMNSSKKSSALEEIKARLNIAISDEDSDFSDVINSVDHNYSSPPVIKCIMYYSAGTVCAKYLKHSNCSTCRHAFLSSAKGVNNIESSISMNRPEARFINAEGLIHPNSSIFSVIEIVEKMFSKHCRSTNVFDLILYELS